MNTNETISHCGRIPTQPLSNYDPEVERRVGSWFDAQRPLVWIPILSQENFPDTPRQVLDLADAFQEAIRLPIAQIEDLLELPAGITGWLMPADEEDTDVACGQWDGEVYILGVKHKLTGRKQTLRGEVPDSPGSESVNSQDQRQQDATE